MSLHQNEIDEEKFYEALGGNERRNSGFGISVTFTIKGGIV
jgi:hypothetical protein